MGVSARPRTTFIPAAHVKRAQRSPGTVEVICAAGHGRGRPFLLRGYSMLMNGDVVELRHLGVDRAGDASGWSLSTLTHPNVLRRDPQPWACKMPRPHQTMVLPMTLAQVQQLIEASRAAGHGIVIDLSADPLGTIAKVVHMSDP